MKDGDPLTSFDLVSQEFVKWATLIAWDVVDQGDLCVVANVGSEIRYVIRWNSFARFVLTTAERIEDEQFLLVSDQASVIERYLTMVLGRAARSMRSMPRLVLPWEDESVPFPERLEIRDDKTVLLTGTLDGAEIVFADLGTPQPAVRYSHIADISLPLLRDSFLDGEGRPALRRFVKASAESLSTSEGHLREPGEYAEFDGRLHESQHVFPGQQALLVQVTTGGPDIGFEATTTPNRYSRRVDPASVTQRIHLSTRCSYAGGGPFVVTMTRSDDPSIVRLTYDGGSPAWAAALDGFTTVDSHDTGGTITGWVPVADLRDVHEEIRALSV